MNEHAMPAMLIEQKKQKLEAATKRRGEFPTDGKSKHQLIHDHVWQHHNASQNRTNIEGSISTVPLYPPSTVSLHNLKQIYINDLQLETHHRGFYVLLKALTLPTGKFVVTLIMEDENTKAVTVEFYHQEAEKDLPFYATASLQDTCIIKEPYFTIATNEDYCIRVDHVTDMIWLSEDDERTPSCFRSMPETHGMSPIEWKNRGNDAMAEGKYTQAARLYTSALKLRPTFVERQLITLNRSQAYLKAGFNDAALDDVKSTSSVDEQPVKGLYRASQALYHLEKYQECHDKLVSLLVKHPENEAALREISRAKRRLTEQENGQYDFRAMYIAAKSQRSLLDNATYIGPVEIRQSEGRGRGLFTTKPVAAGELLLCEKAFSYSSTDTDQFSPGALSKLNMLVDMQKNSMIAGTQVSLIRKIIAKLRHNPSLMSRISLLHHGNYIPVNQIMVDDTPVIDTTLIYQIVSLNTFGCPLTSLVGHADGRPLRSVDIQKLYNSAGIWTTAAFINHSCYSNAQRSFIGDMQIIRAACDIPADTEITFVYQAPDGNGSGETHKALENWGFQCTCVICYQDNLTSSKTFKSRTALLDELEASFKDQMEFQFSKAEKLLAAIEQTYTVPAIEVPRLALWQPYLFVTRCYAENRHPQGVVNAASKVLVSLGFVVEGLPTYPSDSRTSLAPEKHTTGSSGPEFRVKRWGLMVDFVIEVLMHMWAACRELKPEICGGLEAAARLAYKICLGEDETFWEMYGKFYGMAQR